MWTNISKPSGAGYTNVSKPTGASYTSIAKPNGTTTLRAGMTMGLLIPLTNAVTRFVGNPWVDIAKPT